MYRPFFIGEDMLRRACVRIGLPVLMSLAFAAHAQTMVMVAATGEIKAANDEAHVTFMIEEQDKDKAAAASRVNQKMKQGTDIIKREDSRASLKTRGYYTYPVYVDEAVRQGSKRQIASWRVGQYLQVSTTSLNSLPKTVAAAQQILALNGLQFGLSASTLRKIDEKRIEVAYRNLMERIAYISKAMGRQPADAVLDTVDFESPGGYAPAEGMASQMAMRKAPEAEPIEEPSFEPGETTLQMRVAARVKFK